MLVFDQLRTRSPWLAVKLDKGHEWMGRVGATYIVHVSRVTRRVAESQSPATWHSILYKTPIYQLYNILWESIIIIIDEIYAFGAFRYHADINTKHFLTSIQKTHKTMKERRTL